MKSFITKHAWELGVYVLAFIAPIQGILILLGFLLIADLFTGIWKALKAGQPIKSHKLSNTVAKMAIYSVVIIATHGMEVVFPLMATLNMTNIAGGFICLVELKSIYENASAITGLDIWTHLMNRAKGLKKLTDDMGEHSSDSD